MAIVASEITEIFGLPIERVNVRALSAYPALYGDMFRAIDARIGDSPCLLLEIKGEVRLVALLKAIRRIEEGAEIPCVVMSPNLSVYQRRRLSEEGIAWIRDPDTFHIPFLAARSVKKPKIHKSFAISPQVFRLLAKYLAGSFDGDSTQQVAKALGRSLSSTNDYFTEINALFPNTLISKGRAKFLRPEARSRIMDQIVSEKSPVLDPVKKPVKHFYRMDVDDESLRASGFLKGGMTALAERTMMADDPWKTFAIGRKAFKDSDWFAGIEEVNEGDGPNLLIEVWPYELDERCSDAVLPMEVWLSLRDEAERDERIAAALEELLGEGACQS